MLHDIIISKTRVSVLIRLFLNSDNTTYLKELVAGLDISNNSIRKELNHLEKVGLLKTYTVGNKKIFKANNKHSLFPDIHSMLLKHTGIYYIVERVKDLAGLHSIYLTGHLARGKETPIIDILVAGKQIDVNKLYEAISVVEKFIGRRVRYMVVDAKETNQLLTSYPEAMLMWTCSHEK